MSEVVAALTDFRPEQKRAREVGVSPVAIICIDGLNAHADDYYAGRLYLSDSPPEPSFWFYNLAIDGLPRGNHSKPHEGPWREHPGVNTDPLDWLDKKAYDLLNENARALLSVVDITECERWCVCCDEAFRMTDWGPANRSRGFPEGWEPCWPCLFDCHERCSNDCADHLVCMRFPRKIMERQAT